MHSSTLVPPTRKTLGPNRRNNPMRSLFAAVNNGIVNDCFSYANPTKSEPKLPTLLVPTVIVAAVIAPTGTGCDGGASVAVEGGAGGVGTGGVGVGGVDVGGVGGGCTPMVGLISRATVAPHPESIELAATAAKPYSSRRRDRARPPNPEPNPCKSISIFPISVQQHRRLTRKV
jgi:hypothetical protein